MIFSGQSRTGIKKALNRKVRCRNTAKAQKKNHSFLRVLCVTFASFTVKAFIPEARYASH
jgi:hypothetical protein